MRIPLCFSSKPTTTDEPIRPPPRSIAHARTASTADIYHPWVEPDPTTLKKAGCIFCDVSKEKGFAVVHEDEELIAFRDRSPRAKVHLLIIPRYHIADSVKSLTSDHVPLLDRMISLADTLILSSDPSSPDPVSASARPKLGFHIPPFSSVPHLHLHVLVPPYTFLGKLKYPISHRSGGTSTNTFPEDGKGIGKRGSGKGWSWFVEARQARGILERGGSVKIGRS
ncbi:HIT-like domain-containing protein [Dioszegia hungarica]|uniref:HIT-like domain-containing protein n=1 Tax=Dioszegia hungarica TaxID=4972 RepID=A0AA38H8X3_9TREE|nr:HIT-like domain-containing protein [Dioszegia hungarica]KAI9634509.1 HIT-like domain-containing protein [Dioszegia hungarica]